MTDRPRPRPASRAHAGDRDLQDHCQESAAYREMIRQRDLVDPSPTAQDAAIAALTGESGGPAVYELRAIWRAALADESSEDTIGRRRYISPLRFVNGWPHQVSAREDLLAGRILVDRAAALSYCMHLDSRVMDWTIEAIVRHRAEAVEADPIGAMLDASRGGPLALMTHFPRAMKASGLNAFQLATAVWELAKVRAAGLDDITAESLIADVRDALEQMPRLVEVEGHG